MNIIYGTHQGGSRGTGCFLANTAGPWQHPAVRSRHTGATQVQKLSQCTMESPVHKEPLIPPCQGSNRPSQPCTTLPYWPVHVGFTHGHSGLSNPSPTSFVPLNKPRRGLGSPGKMKWCEFTCQQLNQRTNQTTAISTAKSSFTSRGT